jgi:ATP-dependent Clp protease adapter protein ClpS
MNNVPKPSELPVPVIEEQKKDTGGEGWAVILYNDDVHSILEVVFLIVQATGFTIEAAEAITMKAHNSGKAIVLITTKNDAEKIAKYLSSARLRVEVKTVG